MRSSFAPEASIASDNLLPVVLWVEFKSSEDNKPNKAFDPIQFLPYQALSSPLNINTLTGKDVLIFFSFKFAKSKKPATTPARPSKFPP